MGVLQPAQFHESSSLLHLNLRCDQVLIDFGVLWLMLGLESQVLLRILQVLAALAH